MKQGKNRQSNRPILSICMIVKNEEKNLERCLRSLRPLMEEVKSELIITDTGSTDRTVEIAEQYTDHIIPFEWCDDFAAARNTGLEVAKGEWVMAIDADEELIDDLSELIRFFNSKLRYQYVRASAIMKNCINEENRDMITNEQNVNHFFRMDTHPRYRGKIHESVELISPCFQFGFIGYHYGYAYKNEEERLKKMKRNMELLRKELEEFPHDLRILISTLESAYDEQEIETLIERVKEETVKSNSPVWMMAGYKRLTQEYMGLKRWDKVVETVKEYENSRVAGFKNLKIVTLDIWYTMLTALFMLKRYEEGIIYVDRYLSVYREYESGKLERAILMHISIDSFHDLRYNKTLLIKTEMLYRLGRHQEAADELQKIREKKLDSQQFEETFNMAFVLIQQVNVKLSLNKFYIALKETRIRSEAWEKVADALCLTIETRISCCTKENRKKIAESFLSEANDVQDDFERAMELLSIQGTDGWEQRLSEHVKEIKNWERAFPEFYYMAWKAEVELPKRAYLITLDRMQVVSGYLLTAYQNELLVLMKTILSMTGKDIENKRKLTFGGDILEKAIRLVDKGIAGNEWSDEEKKAIRKRLLRGYAKVMKNLLDVIYQKEVLVPENVDLISIFHQRGYWLSNAYMALDTQNFEQYETCVKGLVTTDKTMKSIAGWLIDEYEEKKNLNQDEKARTEFEELAKSVKESVKVLAEKGQIQQAIQVLLQLKKLCPEDAEIDKMIKELTEV